MDTQQVIDMVTQRVKETANVGTVFGEPVEAGGATLIPVACIKVYGGGGGGSGRTKGGGEGQQKDKGMGLGLHVMATPVGYIEVLDGEARMVDIVDKNQLAFGGLLAGGLVAMGMLKMAARRARYSS